MLAEVLSEPLADPMSPEWVAVPTVGMRRWLALELARSLGASGPGTGDGVAANIEFTFPGALSKAVLAAGSRRPGSRSVAGRLSRLGRARGVAVGRRRRPTRPAHRAARRSHLVRTCAASRRSLRPLHGAPARAGTELERWSRRRWHGRPARRARLLAAPPVAPGSGPHRRAQPSRAPTRSARGPAHRGARAGPSASARHVRPDDASKRPAIHRADRGRRRPTRSVPVAS